MKRFRQYVLNFVLSLIFHWYWSIPAWILLILHFVLGISIWWFAGAFALYVIGVRIFVHAVGWLVSMGNEDEKPQKNINPYSVKSKKHTQALNENTEKSGVSDNPNTEKRKKTENKLVNTAENRCPCSIEEREKNDIR